MVVVDVVDVYAFRRDGFVRVEQAAPVEIADAARDLLWEQIGLSPYEPATWTSPVVWAADLTGAGPFGELAGSVVLADTLDEICGAGRWQPRGWHIDANTPLPGGEWAVSGRPHTLLVLTLLSEVGPTDAPTRIRVGSHRDVARVLGPDPVDFVAAGAVVDDASRSCPVAHATGRPGDMYVVHPFTAHAADVHRGSTPRFMSQAPVMLTDELGPQGPPALACVWDRPSDQDLA
ncbi:phytanoyl-CoA dioxygenase family protein [Mycobacterium sp. TNTM28]|uniref:Phytanoyl-CoA dioxygenase family protein n=1 Tax=[Mycobacterium] fortunisiensis TaxID=2600579 RepID=A0ABS6KJ69_9MYCO|nr:mitomycin antibiotics/polyketide fumonisin biosynthesis protein [[Mycobacterium] fortunisiensis]MBU9763652.1 phytanoyl-CoA dioxygenase family protein [[Mycobacterium] fortunisiensis]